MGRIQNLQALRAYAAMMVILFHVMVASTAFDMSPYLLSRLEAWGAHGVDIFFVISGFVMFHTQLAEDRDPEKFFKQRIIRIVPLYWLLTSVIIFLYLVKPATFRAESIPMMWGVKSFAFMCAYEHVFPILQVGWTLEFEVLFYLVVGMALILSSQVHRVFLCFLLMSMASLIFYLPEMLEFLLGIVAGIVYHTWRIPRWVGVLMVLLGLVLFAFSIGQSQPSGYSRIMVWGVPAWLVVLGAGYGPQVASGVLQYLGDASYSIYLVQSLSIPVFYRVASSVGNFFNTDLLVIAAIIFTVCCGVLLHQYVDVYMRARLTHRFSSGNIPARGG